MKRLSVILLLSVYLLSATELRQLLKAPVLVEHFLEHKALNVRISLEDFLYMHYTGHDMNDNDDERDRQLPFKSHDNFVSIDLQTVPQHPQSFTFFIQQEVSENETAYKRQGTGSSYLSGIWQPPRCS